MKREAMMVLLSIFGLLIFAGSSWACECNNQEADNNEKLMRNQHISMEVEQGSSGYDKRTQGSCPEGTGREVVVEPLISGMPGRALSEKVIAPARPKLCFQ